MALFPFSMCRYMITTSHDQYSESPPSHPRLVQVRKRPSGRHGMAVLLNHHEEALKDVNRQQVKAGATVFDVLFVDGIARGTNTIPQQNSNRRAMASSCSSTGWDRMPAGSRGVAAAINSRSSTDGGCMRTLQLHSGAEFESGAERSAPCTPRCGCCRAARGRPT